MSNDAEVVSAAATEAGVSVVTQRGAVIGVKLLMNQSVGHPVEPADEEGSTHA